MITQEIIKAEDYGLEPTKANELTSGLSIIKAERELLIDEFNEVSQLEITEENIPIFRELRLKIVKNRTQGINKWHKSNKESAINEQMEEMLMNAEKYFETLKLERIKKLQAERVSLLSEYVEDAGDIFLANMENDVWEVYLAITKKAYLGKIEAEKQAELERN